MLKNINILNEVSKVGNLLGGSHGSNSAGTPVKTFAGTMSILNGVASTQDLKGELNAGTLTAKGTLNLANQDVNMHVTAALASSAAGQSSGGLLNTVLPTAKGQFLVPLLVTGNLAHPVVTPDAAEMAKLRLNNLGGAKGAIGGILGGLLGGQQPSPDGKTKKPVNPLGSLLDQFGKKK